MIKLPKRAIKRTLRIFGFQISRIPQHPSSDSIPILDVEEVLKRLDDRFRSTLLSMYEDNPQRGIDGQMHYLDNPARISPEQGMWLYDMCLSSKPESTLEIGMAYGFSTLFFLAAIANSGQGHHTAIDPYQNSYWHGIGLTLANEHSAIFGGKSAFRFIEERSDRAATDLAREKQYFDIVFVDGNHRYDDVLVDFYLYAQLVSNGGCIIFDDMWMSSVKSAVAFIRTNRHDFKEVVSPIPNVAAFQKIGEDYRSWDEFSSFEVFPSSGLGK